MPSTDCCGGRGSADFEQSAALLSSNENEWDDIPQCAPCRSKGALLKKIRVIVIIQSIINAVALFTLAYFAISQFQAESHVTTPSGPCESSHVSTSLTTPALPVDAIESNHGPSFDPSLGGDRYLQYTPKSAADSIQYVDQVFSLGTWANATAYQGWPNDENEKLWSDLYLKNRAATTEVPEEEYATLLNSSNRVPIPGHTDKFFVGLSIFHVLHCLDDVRKAFYPRRYPDMSMVKPDGTLSFKTWAHVGKCKNISFDLFFLLGTRFEWYQLDEYLHLTTLGADHCIDSVRQQLMCQADIAAFTFDWRAEKMLEPMVDTIHVCRNFSKIQQWAEDHYVNLTNSMKKLHVEEGKIVDYTGTLNPEELLAKDENAYAPEWWLKLQIEDYFDDNTLSAIGNSSSQVYE